MQEHVSYIADVTRQKECNLSMPKEYIIKKWIQAGKNTWLHTTTIHWHQQLHTFTTSPCLNSSPKTTHVLYQDWQYVTRQAYIP